MYFITCNICCVLSYFILCKSVHCVYEERKKVHRPHAPRSLPTVGLTEPKNAAIA